MSSAEEARKILLGDEPLKLHYFPIAGAAEPVRIALHCASIPFVDVPIVYKDWPTTKTTFKYAQVPEITLPNDGGVFTQSGAMLRLAGEADLEGKLYPASDMKKRYKIEEILGLVDDLRRAWTPALYMSMRPETFGYPSDWAKDEKEAKVKELRSAFMESQFPRFMGYFADLIKESGGDKFLAGEDLTIADIYGYCYIGFYGKGIADHIPTDCLDSFPEVKDWLARVSEHPKVAAYLASK